MFPHLELVVIVFVVLLCKIAVYKSDELFPRSVTYKEQKKLLEVRSGE